MTTSSFLSLLLLHIIITSRFSIIWFWDQCTSGACCTCIQSLSINITLYTNICTHSHILYYHMFTEYNNILTWVYVQLASSDAPSTAFAVSSNCSFSSSTSWRDTTLSSDDSVFIFTLVKGWCGLIEMTARAARQYGVHYLGKLQRPSWLTSTGISLARI